MLRVWVTFALLMTAIFAGIGLAASKAWGWSEYASDKLYVAYFQQVNDTLQFYIVNADGSGNPETLTWKDSPITELVCSWDGRTLAFVTDDERLHVITESQTLVDLPTNGLSLGSVANNGTVALYSGQSGTFLVRGSQIEALPFPESAPLLMSAQITSKGLALWWGGEFMERVLADENGHVSISHTSIAGSQWLASEQMFLYQPFVDGLSLAPVLVDATTKREVPLPADEFGVLSPDSRYILTFSSYSHPIRQIYVVNTVRGASYFKQLTNDSIDDYPDCFLTFRPQMLIAGS